MSTLRAHNSPLLTENALLENPDDPLKLARLAESALHQQLVEKGVTFLTVLQTIAEHDLLEIPRRLRSFIDHSDTESVEVMIDDPASSPVENDPVTEEEEEVENDEIDAWAAALDTPFSQIKGYRDYIEGHAIYRTHQGVKGNEFDRVMVIMDDDEAGGFMFSYEQYFGAKELSKGTMEKLAAGEETGLDRTRRLFYVTSTRAKTSLSHVIYSKDTEAVRANLIERRFADEDEIIVM